MGWDVVAWIDLRVAKMMLQTKTKFRHGSKNMITGYCLGAVRDEQVRVVTRCSARPTSTSHV
jgi:hypothetical protein